LTQNSGVVSSAADNRCAMAGLIPARS
jgi:hypothetical protein